MDFEDTPEQAAWRQECRAWLDENVPKVVGSGRAGGPPSEEHAMGSPDWISLAKAWQRAKFEAGLAKIPWEPELGGRNGTTMEQVIFDQEEARHPVPAAAFVIGLGMIAPTLRAHGTDSQASRYLVPLLRGDEIWCQLFSEPGAGSDVASLSTMAVRDGDEWVLNGQKVWTSGAQYSDFGEIICRTDPEVPKHRGITAFIVDMHAPGVTIRPLRQMNGASSFNEVFFDDVRVPVDNVIGDVNDGWRIAITTLMNERVAIGAGGGGGRGGGPDRLIKLAARVGAGSDPLVRQSLADAYIRGQSLKFIGLRTRTAAAQGKVPGPEGSVAKLAGAELGTRTSEAALSMLGPAAVAGGDETAASWRDAFLSGPAGHIAGGTDQVQKNIIGERVLGLPGEPRADRELPWRELPR
ncbi:MAG TPA: acyl-CoA dehydrogenase family protein [Acidimicrobiales bacterium]|nr:acyl-CoA dehydrogenase family protein [Acidimicrobiales bacterium]